MKKDLVFLGVVNRDKTIDIPWRGTAFYVEHDYEEGQNVLVTLEIGDNTICAKVTNVDYLTRTQFKEMRDEAGRDWDRFTQVFQKGNMGQKVRMLKALEINARNELAGERRILRESKLNKGGF